MGTTRPPYSPEFRDEAVRLVGDSGKSLYQIARDLGVSEQSLRNWGKQADLADFPHFTDAISRQGRGRSL